MSAFDIQFSRIRGARLRAQAHTFSQWLDLPNSSGWDAWSPTGARTNKKDHYLPREIKTTLNGLPSLPVQVVGMATADGEAPRPTWEKVSVAFTACARIFLR